MSTATAIPCEECGTELDEDDDETYGTDKHGTLCRECYDEYVETCQLCGNDDVYPANVSEFIVVKNELAGRAMCPGIYLVLARPFIFGSMLGGGSIQESYVLFVDKLPKPDKHYEISGYICKGCAKPYTKTLREAYAGHTAKWLDANRWGRPKKGRKNTWDLETERMRAVILANPDMLRDLECDTIDEDSEGNHLCYADASAWKELKERCKLPDGIPTYHELVFVEHKGVKIYYCSDWQAEDSTQTGWLTWHPEPRFRNNGHGKDCFSASSLPQYIRRDEDTPSYYDYEQKKRERAAVIAAIDAGMLTQQGPQGIRAEDLR